VQPLHQTEPWKSLKGFVQKPIKLIQDPTVHHAAKCVYDAVAYLVWKGKGACDEPVEVIASWCNVSRRQTLTALRALTQKGYIWRTVRGYMQPDRYTLPDAKAEAPVLAPVAKVHKKAWAPCQKCGAKAPPSKFGCCQAGMRAENRFRKYLEAKKELGTGATRALIAAQMKANEPEMVRFERLARERANLQVKTA